MSRILSTEQPNQYVGPEVRTEKDNSAYFFVKKVNNATQEQQRYGVGNKMVKTSVKQGRDKDPDYPECVPGYYSECAERNAGKILNEIDRPHDDNDSERYNGTAKPGCLTHALIQSDANK